MRLFGLKSFIAFFPLHPVILATIATIVFCLAPTPAASQTAPATCWNLVWSDEFNGTSINTGNWGFDTGCNAFGNSEWENYTNSPTNSYVSGGNLVLNAVNTGGGQCGYTSARLTTYNKIHFTYGRIEARIKAPYGQGIWPAFWMLGEDINTSPWPACGEIDIMEMIGGGSGKDNINYGTAHWLNGTATQAGGSTSVPWPAKLADAFHVYDIEWNATSITWFFDGTAYYTLSTTAASMSAFQGKDFYILLNLAVGGTWPGYPDSTTVFPQQMLVDYVRWYQPVTCAGTATFTPTDTNTPTATFTRTNTSTATKTNTPTNTFTNTPSNTFTRTITNTPTNTSTNTNSFTGTPTATYSRTPTFSATKTPTPTNSSTNTPTNSGTPTNSFTETASFTRSYTQTSTNTSTSSSTPTASATSTRTFTGTATFTNTSTHTATNSSTLTPANTSSPTKTNTLTNTFTGTPTPTTTSTSTYINTFSPTVTNSATSSPTGTLSPTSTSTATGTPTHTQTSTNTSFFTSTATRTNSPTSTPTPTSTFSATSTLTVTRTSTASSTGTFSLTPTATFTNTRTSTSTTTASFTPTYTYSSTSSFTLTHTNTWTSTTTPTFSSTSTYTPTATSTASATSTVTRTATAASRGTPIIYPNPASGPTVNILPPSYSGSSDMKVEIFTVAFRKVQGTVFPNVPSGVAVTVELTDRWGRPLANGLYYVVVVVNGKQSVTKLLILR